MVHGLTSRHGSVRAEMLEPDAYRHTAAGVVSCTAQSLCQMMIAAGDVMTVMMMISGDGDDDDDDDDGDVASP